MDLSTRLMGINPTNSVVIPKSLVLKSIVLAWILIYRNWSILFHVILPLNVKADSCDNNSYLSRVSSNTLLQWSVQPNQLWWKETDTHPFKDHFGESLLLNMLLICSTQQIFIEFFSIIKYNITQNDFIKTKIWWTGLSVSVLVFQYSYFILRIRHKRYKRNKKFHFFIFFCKLNTVCLTTKTHSYLIY